MKKAISLALAALMTISALSGCGNSSNATPSESASASPAASAPAASESPAASPSSAADVVIEKTEGEMDEVQIYNTVLGSEPMSLDIGRSSDTYGSTIINNTYETLTRSVLRDGNFELIPAGAKSWSGNADGTVWTFILNDNFWSDGVPVTAHDYEYGIKRVVDPETGAPLSHFLDPILNFEACNKGDLPLDELGVKAIDDKTLEITLGAPSPYFLSLTYHRTTAPQRKDLVEEHGEKFGSEAEYTASCGPFKLVSWVHNSKIELAKNEHYWDKENVKLEQINIAIIADETTRLNAFDAGEIDYISTAKAEFLTKFNEKGNSNYISYPSATLTYSFFNTQNEVFSNANIRKAFMLGIDREEINDMCFDSMRIPTYGWVVPSMSLGIINFREAAGDPILEMYSTEPTPQELLIKGMEELGLGSDPSTLKVTFSLAGTDTWFRNLGEYLQQAYKESLGINLEIDFSEWSIFIDNVEKGNYQIGFMGWGASYNDPNDVLSLHTSGANAIYTGWTNERYDELIAQAAVELDENKRLELYIEAERILLVDNAVVNPLATSKVSEFFRDYVKGEIGVTFTTIGYKGLYISGK